jgi:hypothetical protein
MMNGENLWLRRIEPMLQELKKCLMRIGYNSIIEKQKLILLIQSLKIYLLIENMKIWRLQK